MQSMTWKIIKPITEILYNSVHAVQSSILKSTSVFLHFKIEKSKVKEYDNNINWSLWKVLYTSIKGTRTCTAWTLISSHFFHTKSITWREIIRMAKAKLSRISHQFPKLLTQIPLLRVCTNIFIFVHIINFPFGYCEKLRILNKIPQWNLSVKVV